MYMYVLPVLMAYLMSNMAVHRIFSHYSKKVSGMNATFMKCHWILCLGFKVIGKRYLYGVLVNGISILPFFIS